MNSTDTPRDTSASLNAPPTAATDLPRSVRLTRETHLPLDVRKELLITRAALERYDCTQALHDVKDGARRITRLGTWLPRFLWAPRMDRPQSWFKLLGLAKSYPVLSSGLSLALPLLRRTPVLRWSWKLSKVGIAAGAGYWLYSTWRAAKRDRHDVPVPRSAAATVGPDPRITTPVAPVQPDTGFRDPLVR
ncbi:DUF3318 domain-containing protein [Cupriavidus respiraculi]|uniref:DUF3318 domain-containing protein n=1 Tax=Cupriavidus respiraculi TaxID=195930 RepID=A0ABM8XDD8_9BURK|nr:DUF3318 domain-containing protein [Cupriavidus respiraculi]MBY4948852.1 DUF3318 domain-containing protein [Cupriavidus respiraculi]CAG9178049.1 hypothetical protein LMG21510_03469 [Cupriavidus respiraculi]